MSYSFQYRAATRAEARAKAQEQFDEVVRMQPVHVKDRVPALTALDAFLNLLIDDESKDIMVSCHGSASYDWAPDVEPMAVPLTHASVGLSAYLVHKVA